MKSKKNQAVFSGRSRGYSASVMASALMSAGLMLASTNAHAVTTSVVSVTAVTPPNNPNPVTRNQYPYQIPVGLQLKVVVKASSGKARPTGTVTVTKGSGATSVTVSGQLVTDSSCSTCASVVMPAIALDNLPRSPNYYSGNGASQYFAVNYAGNTATKMSPSAADSYFGLIGAYTSTQVALVDPSNKIAVSGGTFTLTDSVTGGIAPYDSDMYHYLELVEAYPNPSNITAVPMWYSTYWKSWSSWQNDYPSKTTPAPQTSVKINVPGLYRIRSVNSTDSNNIGCEGIVYNVPNSGEPNRCGYVTVKVVDKSVQNQFSLVSSDSSPAVGETFSLEARLPSAMVGKTITFKADSQVIGTQAVGANGTATLNVTAPSADTVTYSAQVEADFDAGFPATEVTAIVKPGAAVGHSEMVSNFEYDANGNLTAKTRAYSESTTLQYNRQSQPVLKSDSLGVTGIATSTATFDRTGQLTSTTNARGHTTTFTASGASMQTSSPDTGNTTVVRDAAGRITSRTDARGKVTNYTYDVSGRLKSETFASGIATTYEYHGGATPVQRNIGKITKIADESGQSTFDWTAGGMLLSKVQTTNGKVFAQTYEYGTSGASAGKLVAEVRPGNTRLIYSYGTDGQLSSIGMNPVNASGTAPDTATVIPLLSNITWSPSGKVLGWTWESPSAGAINPHAIRTYDTFGRINSYSLGQLDGKAHTRSIHYDDNGRPVRYRLSNPIDGDLPALDQVFSYDGASRLTSANVAGSNYSYGFDKTHSRIQETVGAATYNNTISATSNRLVTDSSVSGLASLTFDAAGNTLTDGNATYTYSDRGRLASATAGGVTTQYKYNALEQRVAKLGANNRYFVYDGLSGLMVGEYDANGAPVYETVYLAGIPVAVIKTSGQAGSKVNSVHYIHADHLNTARVIVDRDNLANVRWRWDQAEPFGATAANENHMGLGAFVFNQRFPGQVYDAETGLHQNWRRTYNPRTGRYLESDPIGLQGGTNTYEYVGGAPTMATDLTGELAPNVIAGLAIATASGIGSALTADWRGNPQQAMIATIVGAGVGFVNGFTGAGIVATLIGKTSTNIGGQILAQGALRMGTSGLGSVANQMAEGGNVNLVRVALEAVWGASVGGPLNGTTFKTAARYCEMKGHKRAAVFFDRVLSPHASKGDMTKYLHTTVSNEMTAQMVGKLIPHMVLGGGQSNQSQSTVRGL